MSDEWPERPTCHRVDSVFKVVKGEWRTPNPHTNLETGDFDDRGFRTCDYCGSINPQDLYEAMQKHTISFEMADWKYGYPHKLYVHGIPNPLRGQMVARSKAYKTETVDGKSVQTCTPTFTVESDDSTSFAKFYTQHLEDDGYNVAAFHAICRELWKRTGVLFSRTPSGPLRYRCAPYDEELAKTFHIFVTDASVNNTN